MITVKTFTFNPYQENTYILIDNNKNAIIIDPGMHNTAEENVLKSFIEQEGLNPIHLLNTHCHVDHVLGNHFVYETWGLKPQFHEGEIPVFVSVLNYAPQMGFRYEQSPIPTTFLIDKQLIPFGDQQIEVILAPGHSPAHVCFYIAEENILIGGDVLFRNSIGRTDLPGGDHQTLLDSIKNRIYTLPEDTTVYPGHGPSTSIGFEKETNPFVRG